MLLGNDVAKYQGNIDWNLYSKNSNFVILKATEGNGYMDPTFTKNQTEARRVGIALGYYHFARPDLNNTPEAEADYFLKTIGKINQGEFLCLDYEPNWPGGDAVSWCKKWLDHISGKLNGYKCLIYLNQSQTQGFNWKPVVDANHGLWIAAYTNDPNKKNYKIGAWPFAAMHQWTNAQTVPGLPTKADGNSFFGDLAMLKKYGYTPVATPTPTPPVSSPSVINDPTTRIDLGPEIGVQELKALRSMILDLRRDNETLKETVKVSEKKLVDVKSFIGGLKSSIAQVDGILG